MPLRQSSWGIGPSVIAEYAFVKVTSPDRSIRCQLDTLNRTENPELNFYSIKHFGIQAILFIPVVGTAFYIEL
ncbi:hypothetical protein ABEW19_20680 [Paenibacillus illinoisensis]|uniref:hypothetical protein n=1 Tax=Paenibacillus illinoisensis TaxID=59845 RepID=UPI003D2C8DAC